MTTGTAREAEATLRALPPPRDADAPPAWIDQPLEDLPPASADAPGVQDAWLARIRELLAAGREADARASLLEFQRRHPDADVPDDLETLLDPR